MRTYSILFHRNRKDFFNGPTKSQSISKTTFCKVFLSTPFNKTIAFFIKCYNSVSSCILMLFFKGSPFTIFGRIISVCVNSFQRMIFCGKFSHINKEVIKRFQPSLTNPYSSCSIIYVITYCRFITTFFHTMPRFINFNRIVDSWIFLHKRSISQMSININRAVYL